MSGYFLIGGRGRFYPMNATGITKVTRQTSSTGNTVIIIVKITLQAEVLLARYPIPIGRPIAKFTFS